MTKTMELEQAKVEASELFAQALGLPDITATVESIGTEEFLKFHVGRRAPVYDHALRETLNGLPETNPYRGLLGLQIDPHERFPGSLEANALRGLLIRSTRSTVDQKTIHAFPGQYVPFQNNEETQAIQPATHLIVGRRGVGKTTLILKAKETLDKGRNLPVVLDMQPYENANDSVLIDVLADLAKKIAKAAERKYPKAACAHLQQFADNLLTGITKPERASAALRRAVSELTESIGADLFVFLDDFHLVNAEQQPKIVAAIHGGLKGARGWLKVAGLHSLLKVYDPKTRRGLQNPGDAQVISLDLTLVDPEAAEIHLRKILSNFLRLVGVDKLTTAVAEQAFHRLVWANAGVARDFLQMFSKAIEHAERAGRRKVELSDANLAIGEFGKQKMEDLEGDARNNQNFLKNALEAIEKHCLEPGKNRKKVNAFLIRSESSVGYNAVKTLSDLRMVHLLHQTITPHKAGEQYEAYMLDYSLFTGFRQRRNIDQMLPEDGKQFKAKQLRDIPILPQNFLKA